MNENNEEWDENNFDPTKDAFFSDLMEMEEEIANEGYQLVEHAISLMNSKYYDDSIEVLRQAIGLYAQINRQAEIEAINQKISDIYMLKEQEFRDVEIAIDEIESVEKSKEKPEVNLEESRVEKTGQEQDQITDMGDELIKEAQRLIEIDEYDEALEKYDESFKIYEKMNNISKLQEISNFIEDCYNKKTDFLKSRKKEDVITEFKEDIIKKEMIEEVPKGESLESDIEKQKRIKHLSSLAYKLLAQATEQAENLQYDEAINLFDEANILFKQLSWDHEQKEIQQKIQQLKQNKELYVKEGEKSEVIEEEIEVDTSEDHFEELDKEAKERFHELKGKAEKIFEMERQKEEDDLFQNEISTMVDEAEKMVRNYEYDLRNDVKKTIEEVTCPYPEVIDIYTEIKNKLVEKGWTKQAQPYYLQINIYRDKLQKDIRLRQVEAQKAQKEKELEEMKKMDSIEEQLEAFEKKMEKIEKLRKIESEKEDFETTINSMINKANNLDREYTVALKKKNFIDCPYPEIIEIYRNVQKMLQERGLKQEASYYNNSIRLYKDKLEKDKKLREFEAKKALKDQEYEQTYMKRKEVKETTSQVVDNKREENQNRLDEAMAIIDGVEKIVKKYELSIRRNILEFESPYIDAIAQYRRARKILQEIGWEEEANKLISTIKFYKEKKEKDDKLRALEQQRIKQQEVTQQLAVINREETEKKEKDEQKELELKKERDQKLFNEQQRQKAYMLMDNAKRELILKNFDKAINLYKESQQIFQEIDWKKGISMVNDSIEAIYVKKEKYEKKQKEQKEKEARESRLKTELEKKISKIQVENELVESKKREELLMKQKIKDQEKTLSQEAYNLLEIGTNLLEARKFDETIEKYIQARDIFAKIGWQMEVSRINNDLLLNIKREKREYERLLELRKKTQEAKKERGDLIKKVQTISEDTSKSKKIEKVNKNVIKNLERINMLIDELKYNEAILRLNETIDILKTFEKRDEIEQLKHQIQNLLHESLVPIITLKDINKFKNLKSFNLAYTALDNAHLSLSNNRFMKAISELKEARYNLEEIKFDNTVLKEIDLKMNIYKERISGKKRVITGRKDENVIQEQLSNENAELKSRIEARRVERAKRVQELLKGSDK